LANDRFPELYAPLRAAGSGRQYPFGPPDPLTGWSRPSRDIVVAPKQTFGIEKADFEPATIFPESASALHA